jgi:hypothetical protein
MIKSRLKIEDGDIFDFESLFGFVQVSSDNIVGAPVKNFEQTSYPEQAGVNISPLTVDDTFEYKVSFFINAKGGLETANWKIEEFNSAISVNEDGLRRVKQISFYNDYKKVKIVGYPKPISQATEFWRDSSGKLHDVVCVELVIKVTNPSLCNFNLDNEDYEVFYVQNDVFYVKKAKE